MEQPDTPTPSDDVLLTEIARLARQFAAQRMTSDVADDISQDVTLECLLKIRAGEWFVAPGDLPRFLRRVVSRRTADWVRGSNHSSERNAEHVRDLADSAHAWMSPQLALEDRELNDLCERTLNDLPPTCRRAYLMVREGGESYKSVATRLGVTRSAVSAHIVEAQRRFRRAIAEFGIDTHARDAKVRKRSATPMAEIAIEASKCGDGYVALAWRYDYRPSADTPSTTRLDKGIIGRPHPYGPFSALHKMVCPDR